MSKAHVACLKLRNLPILAKINDKRKAVLENKKEYFNSKSIKLSNLKIECLVRTSCTLTAQLKTSNEQNIKISTSNKKDKKPV